MAVVAHHVRDYLASRTALDQLEDALIPYSFDADTWAPEPLATFLRDVERAIWRVRAQQHSEVALRDTLKTLLDP